MFTVAPGCEGSEVEIRAGRQGDGTIAIQPAWIGECQRTAGIVVDPV